MNPPVPMTEATAELTEVLALTDGTELVIDANDVVRPSYVGPDWIGPALIGVLFFAVVAVVLVLSGGTHWSAGF